MTRPRRVAYYRVHAGWQLRAINSSGDPYSLGMQKSGEIYAIIMNFNPNGTMRRWEWPDRGWQRHGFRANSDDKVQEVGGELECRDDG